MCGSNIAPAIMPAAMFVAVPRAPPPPKEPPEYSPGLSSTLLNSSVLGLMFATPEPPLDESMPFSDTETSMYDYEKVEVAAG